MLRVNARAVEKRAFSNVTDPIVFMLFSFFLYLFFLIFLPLRSRTFYLANIDVLHCVFIMIRLWGYTKRYSISDVHDRFTLLRPLYANELRSDWPISVILDRLVYGGGRDHFIAL